MAADRSPVGGLPAALPAESREGAPLLPDHSSVYEFIPPAIYTRAQLQARFGYRDRNRFHSFLARAMALGFPAPLPGCTRPLKWARAPVDAWFAAGGRPAQIALRRGRAGAAGAVGEEAAALAPPPAPPLDELGAARARIAARAAALSRKP